ERRPVAIHSVKRSIGQIARSAQRSRSTQRIRFHATGETWGRIRPAAMGGRRAFSAISAFAAAAVFIVVIAGSGCGKKGPPLPPLLKVPVAPPDLAASRRGDIVDLQFTVPNTNTDGTRPANVERVEIYAMTTPPGPAPPTLTDAQIVKFGTRIDAVDVKAPRDPNLTTDPDDPSEGVEAPEGKGLDQGAVARVEEALGDDVMEIVKLPPDPLAPKTKVKDGGSQGPLLGPSGDAPSRTYAVVGISTRGKKGPVSKRVAV